MTFWMGIGEFFGISVTHTLASVVAAITAYYIAKMGRVVRRHPFRRIKRGETKNSVLVIGLGKSGKSCLISALTETVFDIPAETKGFSVIEHTVLSRNDSPTHLFFTDYRGQNFRQLISSFIEEQHRAESALRYGTINSLVLVVDLFSFSETEEVGATHASVDADRISCHLDQWNRTALDAVFGLLTRDALRYVCLFVNKADKLESLGYSGCTKELLGLYGALASDLESRCSDYAHFEVIIGSAIRGLRVTGSGGLLASLARHSAPPEI